MVYYIDQDNSDVIDNLYFYINKNWYRDDTCKSIEDRKDIYTIPSNIKEKQIIRKLNIEKHYERYLYYSYNGLKKILSKIQYYSKKYKITWILIISLLGLISHTIMNYKQTDFKEQLLYNPIFWFISFCFLCQFSIKYYLEKRNLWLFESVFLALMSLILFVVMFNN